MANFPRFRLRTLLVLISFAAVGLAAEGLLYPVYAGIVVGLIQEIGLLSRSTRTQEVPEPEVLFALRYAKFWRLSLAALMSVCIILQILLSRHAIQLLKRQDLLSVEPDNDVVAQVSAIVVLSNGVLRWRVPRLASHDIKWTTVLAWIAGATLAAFVLPDAALVHFLVHIATQGIEIAIPRAFQRVGVFPDQRADGFRLFWMSVGAACSVVMAAAVLSTLSIGKPNGAKCRWIKIASFLVLLSVSCTFCVWYYWKEWACISPDLASVRFGGMFRDWLGASALLVILVTTQSYRFARDKHSRFTITADPDVRRDSPLHESFVCLLYLGGFASFTLFDWIRSMLTWQSTFGVGSMGDFIVGLLHYPPFYLSIALPMLSLQLCWTRWRHRFSPMAWELVGLPPRRFFCYIVALSAVAIVGLVTISIYCFVFWLGPWYLIGN